MKRRNIFNDQTLSSTFIYYLSTFQKRQTDIIKQMKNFIQIFLLLMIITAASCGKKNTQQQAPPPVDVNIDTRLHPDRQIVNILQQ